MAQGKATNLCGAKKRGGGTCGRPAGWGTNHKGVGCCKNHGGSTPTQIKGAQRKIAEREALKFGLPREVDPHTALMEELHRTAGIISWYAQEIAEVEASRHSDDPEGQQSAMHESVGGGGGGLTQEEMHVYVRAMHEERKHFAAVAKTCIAVGIEERRVHLAEQQGALMAQMVRGIFADLGIEITEEVQKVVRRQFTLIQGGLSAA